MDQFHKLEEIIKLHPDVHDAAVIGVRHEKWAKAVVIAEVVENKVRENDLLDFDGKIVKWQKPDAVIFVDELPLGSTGSNKEIREQYDTISWGIKSSETGHDVIVVGGGPLDHCFVVALRKGLRSVWSRRTQPISISQGNRPEWLHDGGDQEAPRRHVG